MLNATQEEIAFILDSAAAATWPNTPTTPPNQPQYRYTDEPRQYNSYVNGVNPRPVAPVVRAQPPYESETPPLTTQAGFKSSRPKTTRELCTKALPVRSSTDPPATTVPTSCRSCATHRKSNPQDLTAGNPRGSPVSWK